MASEHVYRCYEGPLDGAGIVIERHMLPGDVITVGYGDSTDRHHYMAVCDQWGHLILAWQGAVPARRGGT